MSVSKMKKAAQSVNAWEYEAEKRQERKAEKDFRKTRQSRKFAWTNTVD